MLPKGNEGGCFFTLTLLGLVRGLNIPSSFSWACAEYELGKFLDVLLGGELVGFHFFSDRLYQVPLFLGIVLENIGTAQIFCFPLLVF